MNKFVCIAHQDGSLTVCIVEAADADCALTILYDKWWTIDMKSWNVIDITHNTEECLTIVRQRG